MTTFPLALIRRQLQTMLAPTLLEIIDESAQHVGHAGALQGGHYHIRIASPVFSGLSAIACHRKIYEALDPLSAYQIHALRISILN